LNSGVNFLLFLFAMNSSWRIFAPSGVSTKPGEDQEAHEDGREIGYAEGFRGGRSQGIREGREAVRREQVSVFGRSTTFAPHQPDPWDQDQDPAERDAIEHEPVSRWTLLRRPWPAAKTETAT
jgi:hypothetical protein